MNSRSRRKGRRRIMDPEKRAAYRAEKRQEERERLENAVRELASSEGWQRWLESRSAFHNYSFNNTLLIASQCPHATAVASYLTWKSLGRQVRQGERGIRIFAPVIVKVREGDAKGQARGGYLSAGNTVAQQVAAATRGPFTDDAPAEEGETETRLRFKSVSVFDVSQTEGEPLPPMPREPIEGDSHADWLPTIADYARSLGCAVTFESMEGRPVAGYYAPSDDAIAVDSSLPPNAQVRALVHELAHALGGSYEEYGKRGAEVIVDAAAYIVCGSLGLDTSGETVPYIAHHGSGDDWEALRTFAAEVDTLASKIEVGIGLKQAREAMPS